MRVQVAPVVCLVIALSAAQDCVHDAPEARVGQGLLTGQWFTTRGGRRVAGFLGVRYAQPPVGQLRFKSPQPVGPLSPGTHNATRVVEACPQKGSIPMSEDCLYLNIYTPNVTPREKYAVLVFFHGGVFYLGSASPHLHGPEYFLDEDIVLVVIQYRIGILGFLSLEHPALPGNLGLKDQREALRWIQTNIACFGGDPSRVTLFGASAGGISINYHMMFMPNEDLFRAAILSSKSAFSLSSFQFPGTQRPLVDFIANQTGCPTEPEAFVDCLRQLPEHDFVRLLHDYKEQPVPVLLVGPMVEPGCVADRLVTADPHSMTTSMPMLLGINEMEGLRTLVELEKDKSDTLFKELDANYESLLPNYLHLENSAKDPKGVANRVKDFYLPGQPINRDHYVKLVEMFSDDNYVHGIVQAARHNKNTTFFYQFNFRGANTVVRNKGSLEYYGVCHGDDMFFFFPMRNPYLNITERDTAMSKKLVKMWTNFAKYLDPNPSDGSVQWEPVTTPDIEFLDIGQENMTMSSGYLKDRMHFWDNLAVRDKPLVESTC